MPPLSKTRTHLPLLYNPFLNCLFNNPHHSKPPFKQTIQELSTNHNDYTILVPPAHILQESYDPATEQSTNKTLLREMCYNSEDFIRSHIIKSSTSSSSSAAPISKVQSVIYNTINGKQILIKNGMVFTGKGFKKSLKLLILTINYFNSYCDYFPKGSKFMLIYIEDSLFGSYNPVKVSRTLVLNDGDTGKTINNNDQKKKFNETMTFEKLLRSFPLLSKAVSDKFYKLFHHNNQQFRLLRTRTRKRLVDIKSEFQNMLEEAYNIISDSVKVDAPDSEQTYNLFNHILSIYPGLDLNKLVHEYVELNLYDKIWSQLIFQFNYPNDDKKEFDSEAIKILTAEIYNKLSCLALNQLGIPVDKPWQINELYRRVSFAINEFSKLSDAVIVNSSCRTKVIVNTFNILTNNDIRLTDIAKEKAGQDDDLIIDADTLIGLLIMVIIHSKVDNLEAHLYYIKHFSFINYSNDGFLNYILSNIDAVLYHLSLPSHEDPHYTDLNKLSQLNYEFWSSIQNEDIYKLERILEQIQKDYGNTSIPNDHFLKSRNINGESCLMFAIKTKNLNIFNILLNYNTCWFSIDEILFDKNTTTNQTLLMTSLIEECHDMTTGLIELITANTSVEEQVTYYNSIDNLGRSIGHYLFHDHLLIDFIGPLINWELKDLNSHTPLFSLCRCYDHSNYSLLISKGFKCVFLKYDKGLINFDKHRDKMGNTLLHVIHKSLGETNLLNKKANLINVNQLNNKNMTPLWSYVKYNRLENLKELLKDERLLFKFEDSKHFYNVFDYLAFSAIKSNGTNKVFKEVERLIFNFYFENYFPNVEKKKLLAVNAKYDPNLKDWVLLFNNSSSISNRKRLETLKQIMYVTKLENPLIIFPDQETFWLNFKPNKPTTPLFNKFRINRLIDNFNLLFISLSCQTNSILKSISAKILEVDNANTGKSTFEIIKEINDAQESAKLKLGEVKLTANQIQEIEFFLRYSLNDLKHFEGLIAKFNKLVSISDIKQSDIRIIYDGILSKFTYNDTIFPRRLLEKFQFNWASEYRNEDSAFKELIFYTMWLELSVIELIKNINKVLDRIKSWRELYDNIRDLNNELKKYEDKISSSTSSSTMPRRNTFTIDPAAGNDTESESSSIFFNFGNILENKKSRYKKLLLIKSEKIKHIMKLNLDVKLDHETIASEISNFLKFKSDFLRFGIKQYCYINLQLLRYRNYELSKILSSIKH